MKSTSRIRFRKLPLVLALGLAVVGLGCESATGPADQPPTQPERAERTTASAATPLHGRSGPGVTVPVRLQMKTVHNVDQSAEALAACPGTPGLAVGEGSGTGTHLGRFEITRLEHCSIDLQPPVELEDISRTGEFTFETPDGSTLYGTYEFLFLPFEQGGFYSVFIEGGTQRFAGATGSLDGRGDPVVCDDPLCLVNAVWKPTLTGTLTLPRP